MKNDKMTLFLNLTVKSFNSWFENVPSCNGGYWKTNWHCSALNKYRIFSVLGRMTVLETNLSPGFLFVYCADLLDILMLKRATDGGNVICTCWNLYLLK